MIKIEVLYPEYMNLYGDNGNIRYLEQSINSLKVLYTGLNDQPKFLKMKIDMLYLGPCTENNQEEIASLLMQYKQPIKDLIESGVTVLATGNALELFGKYIEKVDGSKIKGLGIFNIYAKRVANYRHNELCLGKTKDNHEVVGFKNQMSHLYGKDKKYFLKMMLGSGRNIDSDIEGISYKNFIGTYMLGPVLPLNPYFTKNLIKKFNDKDIKLSFEEDAIKAYEIRLEEFKKLIKGQQ